MPTRESDEGSLDSDSLVAGGGGHRVPFGVFCRPVGVIIQFDESVYLA